MFMLYINLYTERMYNIVLFCSGREKKPKSLSILLFVVLLKFKYQDCLIFNI